MNHINAQLPVYVVDDDESVRDSLAFMLEEHDCDIGQPNAKTSRSAGSSNS